MLWTDKAKKILKKYWGFSDLKEKQINVINELLSGNDVIGLLPTGYGKSFCYLIPPLVTKKAILIISPLISLMDDQKDKLVERNIPVAALHGNNKNKDKDLFEIIDGNIKIIYMSPEYLIKGDGLELAKSLIESNLLGYLAIDEAHCISVWGHDFRPEYLKIKQFRELYPQIPILAVTATATNIVVDEIHKFLTLNNPITVRANFDRPNLFLTCVEYKKEKIPKPKKKKGEIAPLKDISDIRDDIDMKLLMPFFDKYRNDKIIIYTNSRQMTLNIANEINSIHPDGRVSEAYHAGMSKGLREKVQTKFSTGDIRIIVSTVAFGMGVDQIVRCVIIIGAPSSIEEYWQQIGRAGRDNLPAETILFYQYRSIVIASSMLEKECRNPMIKRNKKRNLFKMGEYFYLKTCRRRFVLEHFDQVPKFFCCNKCDNCLNNNNLDDITKEVWNIHNSENKNLPPNKNITPKKDLRFENIKQNLIAQKLIRYATKEKLILINSLSNWIKYVNKRGYTLDNLPDNLRIKIPLQYLYNDKEEDDFDKCEKMLNDFKV
jgi:RecQ family ATP-dependent DNA helicase